MNKILKEVAVTQIKGGCTVSRERIIKETPLTIRIDGQHHTTAMIMAVLEKEYVYGNLFAQGIINSASDIKSLTIKNNTADVVLAGNRKKRPAPPKINSDLKVKPADIFSCVKAILKSDVFAETEAVHSAGLFLEGREAVCITEDLGRHNALDKVIGCALLQGVDFSRTLAASTGRQPSEMILKCRSVNIPLIATKGVPTTLAIEIAEKAGIAIAGLVRGKSMIVYSCRERIG